MDIFFNFFKIFVKYLGYIFKVGADPCVRPQDRNTTYNFKMISSVYRDNDGLFGNYAYRFRGRAMHAPTNVMEMLGVF